MAGWLVGFYGISLFVFFFFMPNPFIQIRISISNNSA